jgi:hypothetical protein
MIAKRSMRSFRTSLMPKDRQEKERLHAYISPLSKCLVLGTIIDRQVGLDSRRA